MYSCIIYFKDSDEKNLIKKKLRNRLINSFSIGKSFVVVRTRKLWKLYFLNFHFRKFKHTFCYNTVFKVDKTPLIPSLLETRYKIEIEDNGWIDRYLYVYFKTVHSVWRIRILSFFLN